MTITMAQVANIAWLVLGTLGASVLGALVWTAATAPTKAQIAAKKAAAEEAAAQAALSSAGPTP